MHGDQLLVANAGDSRCVVSENGKAVPMSFDHKPTDAAEHSRIIKVGFCCQLFLSTMHPEALIVPASACTLCYNLRVTVSIITQVTQTVHD